MNETASCRGIDSRSLYSKPLRYNWLFIFVWLCYLNGVIFRSEILVWIDFPGSGVHFRRNKCKKIEKEENMETSPETVRTRKDNGTAAASKSPKSNSSTAKGRPPKASSKKGKGNEAKAARESTLKMVGYSLLFAILAVAGGIVILKGVSLHQDYYSHRLAAKESASNTPDEPVIKDKVTDGVKEGASKDSEEPPVVEEEPPLVEEEETVEVEAEDDVGNSEEVPQPEASIVNEADSSVPSAPEVTDSEKLHPGEDWSSEPGFHVCRKDY